MLVSMRCQHHTVPKREALETNYQVVIVVGFHLFPFRTEKLSPLTPMVLQCNAGE